MQGYFTHGTHPFNKNSIKDLVEKERIKQNKYLNFLNTWTISDVNKRNTAIKNNLNYIEIFNYQKISNIKLILDKYKFGYYCYL